MSNSLRIGKNALTITLAIATVLWTVGLTAMVAPAASAASFGDLIKGETLSTVYYYGSDGQRYSFPNEKTFFSWNENFDGVVMISDDELADITLAGNIAYRPGSRWIKIASDDKVYAVSTDGSVHWIEDEATAMGLAGDNWNTFIDDVPDVFFVDYTVGDSLTDASDGYDGLVWSDGTDTYLVWDGEARMVSSAGMSANGLQDGFVLSGDGFDPDGLTAGDEVGAELAFLTDAAQMVTDDSYAAGADVMVSMAASSPASATLIAGQGIADLAHFTLTNNSDSSATLTGLAFARTGVSSDSTLSNVYLFDGYMRLTDSATVSDSKVSFNDSSGIATIPAGGSWTVSVRSDVAASTNGQTVGLTLASASDVSFSGNSSASGSFPQAGSIHTIASSPSTFATADFTGSTTPTSASIDPQEGYRVWQRTVSIANNNAWLKVIRFRNIGSINVDDVSSWKFYVSGVQYGEAVSAEDSNGYITFDLTGAPVDLKTGTHTLKVLADIIGGSGRTVTTGLRNSADFVLVDSDYGQPVLATVGSGSFAAMDAGAQEINSGTLTMVKASDSPAGDVTDQASSVTIGRWDVKAFGENIKLENLAFFVDYTDDGTDCDGSACVDSAITLRNSAIFADGVQVGSTASLEADSDGETRNTSYNFGSSLVIEPGTPVVLELRADIYDNDGAENLDADDTLQVSIQSPSSNNAQRLSSGGFFQSPSSDVSANTVTVAAGTMTVAKNTSYANQTVVVPKTAYKVGSWTIKAGTTENINLTQIDVDFDADDDAEEADATDDYTNLYIEYGPVGNMTTSTVKSTVALANSWAINYDLAAGETIYVNAYADPAAGSSDGTDGADFIKAELDVTATSELSATPLTESNIEGQTITYYNAGTFSTAFDGSSPIARNVAGAQEVEAAKFRFTAQNEDYTIKEIRLKVSDDTAAGVIMEARLYDGDTLLGSSVFDLSTNTAALFTGLSIPVANNTHKIITAKLMLNSIGTGAASSQQDLAVTLDTVKYADSQGAELDENTDRVGNEIRAYRSIPTVSVVDLSNSTLVNGQAIDMYKFTITASSQGSIAIKQLKFPVTFADGLGEGDDDASEVLELENVKLYKNGSDISTNSSVVVIQDSTGANVEDGTGVTEDGDDAETLIVIWDTAEEVISAGETVTYVIRATPAGFNTDGDTGETDSVSLYLAGDASHNDSDVCLEDTGTGDIWNLDNLASGSCAATADASSAYNFIWSDNSGSSHNGGDSETGAGDWSNGYKVLNLDLDGETWSK